MEELIDLSEQVRKIIHKISVLSTTVAELTFQTMKLLCRLHVKSFSQGDCGSDHIR